MDKIEEILPRITTFLKDELSKEPLSSKAEKKRLYYVSRIDQVLQDSAAQEIITKYEPLSADSGGGGSGGGGGAGAERRTSSVLRGNVVPTPFNRISFPPAEQKKTVQTNQVTVAYEVLPCDQTYEEVCPNDVYSEVTMHGTSFPSSSSSSSSSNGMKQQPIVHPPYPPPPPPPLASARPPSPPPLYDEAFQSNPDRIPEASDSDTDTDYEEYAEAEEREDDAKKNKESNKINRNSSKLSNKSGRQQNAADLSGKRHTGFLHQKGTFQFQRRFCALCGTRFLCCKSERSLKVILEVDVREYEVVHQERKEGKTSSYPHELRFSCPGKETHLFYTESRQAAEEWVKELRRASTIKQDSVDASSDTVDSASLADDTDRQSENSECNISGGSIEKSKALNQHVSDEVRKKSKLQNILGTFGKKLGNKTKTLFQSIDFSQPQAVEAEQEFGYVSIRSEEFTGDRWFKRFCLIGDGHLNCFTDQWSTDVRPEFSLDLRGAQLRQEQDGKNELKIKLVKDGKEHCLKMTDTMHHGRWLMSLIRETGYASQLAAKALNNKEIYEQPVLYEELAPFIALEGVTEDDTNPDDDEEPPPLPTDSPPVSPMPDSENSRPLLDQKKKPDPEGIYLQPSEWIQDVEELKQKKRKKKPVNAAPCPVQEECAYINRDFALKALNSRERTPAKNGHAEKGSIVSSSSYPNLTSVGVNHNGGPGEEASGTDVARERPGTRGVAGKDSGAGGGKFRPSSALVESLENLADTSESNGRKNCRGFGAAKGSSHSFDRSAGLFNPSLKKQDDQITGVGCLRKSQDRMNTKITWDELVKNNNRSRTSGSESSEDLNNKKMVQNLVQMFEKKV